jgi:hypothetical protein
MTILYPTVGVIFGLVAGTLWMLAGSKKQLVSVQIDAEGKIKAAKTTVSTLKLIRHKHK